MISRLIAASALAACASAHAVDTSWDSTRHLEHFGGSALMAGVATDLTHSELEGFAISFGIGAAKEVADNYTPGASCTLKSLAMDAAGAYVGAKVGGLFINRAAHGFSVGLSRSF